MYSEHTPLNYLNHLLKSNLEHIHDHRGAHCYHPMEEIPYSAYYWFGCLSRMTAKQIKERNINNH